jgi:hypothetical protein
VGVVAALGGKTPLGEAGYDPSGADLRQIKLKR